MTPIEILEEVLNELDSQKDDIKSLLSKAIEQLREPKLPEKKHGDFGFHPNGHRKMFHSLSTGGMETMDNVRSYNGSGPTEEEKRIHVSGNLFDLMEHAGINGKIIALSVEELVMIITSNTDTALNLIKSKL